MTNERQKQTYYGTLNVFTQELLIKTFDKGNSESTIAFLQALLAECPNSRIALIWDGASDSPFSSRQGIFSFSESGVRRTQVENYLHSFRP
jgi:hypothetical protein